MAKVRVEWVKVGRDGDARSPDFLEQLVGDPAVLDNIAAIAVLSAPAPAWPSESGKIVDRGYARVTVLEGGVLVSWGAADGLGDAAGVLAADVGKPVYISIRSGQVLSLVESPDLPAGIGGGASEFTQQQIYDRLGQQILELPPRPLVTDLAKYPDIVEIDVAGADTDELIPAEAGKRHFIFWGWVQTDLATELSFMSAATVLGAPVRLGADDIADIGSEDAQFAEFVTGVGEAFSVAKSTAAALTGKLFKKTV